MKLNNEITNLFTKNRKCIINADLDGLLSGMVLEKFLGWEIVGFSSCSGKHDDELWLYNADENLKECVFVDLPVYIEKYSTIDQHFIAFDKESVDSYKENENKVNPNIIRERVFRKDDGSSEYTMKYPFGTVHFIIAVLENMGVIDESYSFDFRKLLDEFDLADLILRADRVIGNTSSYTPNCVDWSKWLISIGGKNTNRLFSMVQTELTDRILRESKVEYKMINLGCKGKDGDCSNMLRAKDYNSLKNYYDYLANAMSMKSIPVKEITDFGRLHGTRYTITSNNLNVLKKESLKDDVFSFAFVTMKSLSFTYIEGVDNNE